jgi:hypothetical protein
MKLQIGISAKSAHLKPSILKIPHALASDIDLYESFCNASVTQPG